MKASTIIRLILTACLLVAIWLDNKYALYLAVTLQIIANEIISISTEILSKKKARG